MLDNIGDFELDVLTHLLHILMIGADLDPKKVSFEGHCPQNLIIRSLKTGPAVQPLAAGAARSGLDGGSGGRSRRQNRRQKTGAERTAPKRRDRTLHTDQAMRRTLPRRRKRVGAEMAAACWLWLAATSPCRAERSSRPRRAPPRDYAFVLVDRTSRRRVRPAAGLSALSSTAFPANDTRGGPFRFGPLNATSWSDAGGSYANEQGFHRPVSPFPAMPSPLFTSLAQSQFELLCHSLVHAPASAASHSGGATPKPKIGSMALYLPKENPATGQLEFVPAVSHPDTTAERVFIGYGRGGGGTHQPPMVPAGGAAILPGFFRYGHSG